MVSFLCRVGLGIRVSMTVMGTYTTVLANEHSNLTIDHIPDPSFPLNEELDIPSLKAVDFTTMGTTPTVQAQHGSIKEEHSSTVSSSDSRPHLVVQSTQRTDTSPSSLNNPNLLESPTQPIEVKIQRTQAITLQESINLARRNNPSLQISALQL
ncbi:MAG: hypothetical protein ACKO4R_03530, partial [Synechococcales cyanobacterium]